MTESGRSSPSHLSTVAFASITIAAMLGLSLNAPFALASSEAATSRACAFGVPSGSIVNPTLGNILLPNGTEISETSLVCESTSIRLQTTGALANGHMDLGGSYYYTNFQDQWNVPSVPSSGNYGSNQYSALWDGLELPTIQGGDIVQPVLVYGCIASGDCLNQWRFTGYACFHCNQVNPAIYYAKPLFNANYGGEILGSLHLNPNVSFCPNDGPAYTVAAGDLTTGQTENLIICTTDQYQIADTGALEVANLSTCSQLPGYPADGDFNSISYTTSPSVGSVSYSTGSNVSFCNAMAGWSTNPPHSYLVITWDDS